jgi:DNA-binding XRE family transcriptional regulator
MSVKQVDVEIDWPARNEAIALRLVEAREHLKLTQSQFGYRIGITRASMAAYEEGRAPLKCDLGLRMCRHFFISEYWLATGFANDADEQEGRPCRFPGERMAARLTMALAAEKISLMVPPGISFSQGFQRYLRDEYLRLARLQNGFPRIVPIRYESAEYLGNATECMLDFWAAGLGPAAWEDFFSALIDSGNALYRKFQPANTPAKKK